MASTKSGRQPIRLSEYVNASCKSSDKKLHKPRMEPVRIKDLLLSSSKARTPSVDRSMRRTKLFAVPKQTVRRALYGKSPSPPKSASSQSSIDSKDSVSVSKPKTPLTKRNRSILPQAKARQSFLPQPNFIVKKNKQKVVDSPIENKIPTVVEERLSEVMRLSPPQHQRATVIKSVYKKRSVEKSKPVDNCEIVNIEYDKVNNFEKRLIDLEASIVDKENIPPDNHEPLTNEACKFNDIDHRINLDSCQNIRLEKIENDLQIVKDDLKTLKDQQTLLLDFVEKIFKTLSVKFDVPQHQVSEPENISCESSSSLDPLISVAVDNKENNSNNNNITNNLGNIEHDNLTTDNFICNNSMTLSEKKQRRSSISMEERRRSARIAAKLTPRKNDSFVMLENELNIGHSINKSYSAPITPKDNNLIFKSKSARPLREYMAMKASMTFLETPDARFGGFRRAIDYGDDTPARNKSLRRSISSKIFNELEDLYNDSEETEDNY